MTVNRAYLAYKNLKVELIGQGICMVRYGN